MAVEAPGVVSEGLCRHLVVFAVVDLIVRSRAVRLRLRDGRVSPSVGIEAGLTVMFRV